jgi:hypothetical protein
MSDTVIRIGYERLFNMGSFEHEKYTINKEVESDNEYDAFKKLTLDIVDFESDLVIYRQLCERLPGVLWNLQHEQLKDGKEKTQKKYDMMKQMIEEFRTKHKPVFKECKCYYCKNRFTYDDRDETEHSDLPF